MVVGVADGKGAAVEEAAGGQAAAQVALLAVRAVVVHVTLRAAGN